MITNGHFSNQTAVFFFIFYRTNLFPCSTPLWVEGYLNEGIPLLKVVQDQGQHKTRDSSSTLRNPPPPARPTTMAPLEERGQDQRQGITEDSTPTVHSAPAHTRPSATSATLPEIPLLTKGQDQGKGITQDSTSSFLIPPGQSAFPTHASRRKGSSHTHHHWRSWGAPGPKAKHLKERNVRHEAIRTAATARMNVHRVTKLVVTATNVHAAAIMTSAGIVAQAIDRQTQAIKARETVSPQVPPLE